MEAVPFTCCSSITSGETTLNIQTLYERVACALIWVIVRWSGKKFIGQTLPEFIGEKNNEDDKMNPGAAITRIKLVNFFRPQGQIL